MEKETALGHGYGHDDDVDFVDRISELPEAIIHHIMKFLPSDHVDTSRISILSKQFFSAWCSFPVLLFDSTRMRMSDAESVPIQYSFQRLRLNHVLHVMYDGGREPVCDHNQLTKLSRLSVSESNFSLKSITALSLDGINLKAQHLTLRFPLIESFDLFGCTGVTSITLSGAKLKSVSLWECIGLEKVDFDGSTSLDCLRYVGNDYCEINLASRKSLKLLVLEDTLITDQWIKSSFSKLVENLELIFCHYPKKTRWYFEHLKGLDLVNSNGLVEFETPNLERIFYCGSIGYEIPLLITKSFSRLEANLKILVDKKFIRSDAESYQTRHFTLTCFSNFIRHFNQCQTLTLICYSAEGLIYPKSMRASLNPPLYDMKNLVVNLSTKLHKIVELIDSLLWLGPHPNTISIIAYSQAAKTIKFNYHDTTSNINIRSRWQHYLKGVELHKFEDVRERTNLQTYFFSTFNGLQVEMSPVSDHA